MWKEVLQNLPIGSSRSIKVLSQCRCNLVSYSFIWLESSAAVRLDSRQKDERNCFYLNVFQYLIWMYFEFCSVLCIMVFCTIWGVSEEICTHNIYGVA